MANQGALKRHKTQEAGGGRKLPTPWLSRIFVFISILALLGGAQAAAGRRVAYLAAPGVWRIKDSATAQKPLRHVTPTPYQSNNIQWNIYYVDPAGQGFNDNALGADRQAVVLRVLDYISHVMNYRSGTLDILFAQRAADDPDYLAYGGTYFPVDNVPTGFYGGDAYTHLTLGIDPDTSQEDLYCYVNFNYSWNTGTGLPASTQYDLASVLLHELTHGLGMVSLLQANGTSVLPPNANPGIFSTWDRYLGMPDGTGLFGLSGLFIKTPNDLLGSSPGVYFLGRHAAQCHGGTAPPVYTPYPFEDARSLDHWAVGQSGGSIMEPDIGTGVAMRAYTAQDKGALADLGWQIVLPNAAGREWTCYE